MKFTNRDGEIRFYDGTATPWYLKILFTGGDFQAPLGPPRPQETLVLDRQRLDANACYLRGSDAALLEPLPLDFSLHVTDHAAFVHLLDWLEGKSVNGHAMVTTKGSSQRDGATSTPAFADPAKKCLDVEYRLDGPTADIVWKHHEVYFPLDQALLTESDGGVKVSLKGLVYGAVERAAAFTSGQAAA